MVHVCKRMGEQEEMNVGQRGVHLEGSHGERVLQHV